MRPAFYRSRCGLVETYVGNALDVLREMPDASVHCCVTSPPYYGLRDYGTATWEGGDQACDHLGEPFRTSVNVNANTDSGGDDVKNKEKRQPMGQTCDKCGAKRLDQQIGLEESPADFIASLVAVFREVRRVLHPSGVAWVNMGDSYSQPGQQMRNRNGLNPEFNRPCRDAVADEGRKLNSGCKPKDLIGIPWMLAFALRDDGWYLRQDIIWAKPSPMPESVTDRCTKSHEYVFLLAKNPSYFYDAEAIKEAASGTYNWATQKFKCGDITTHHGSSTAGDTVVDGGTKNRRSVWNIASAPYAEAHFATYPPELIRPMIRAGTSEKGVCPTCLAPWARVTEKTKLKRERPNDYVKRVPERPLGDKLAEAPDDVRASASARMGRGAGWRNAQGNTCSNSTAGVSVTTRGWEPTCKCDAGEPISATVLEPFGGSGTTGMVARQEGRRCLMIELNPKYAELHKARVEMSAPKMNDADAPLFADI